MAAKQRRLPRSKWLTCLLLGPVLGGLVATCLVSQLQTKARPAHGSNWGTWSSCCSVGLGAWPQLNELPEP